MVRFQWSASTLLANGVVGGIVAGVVLAGVEVVAGVAVGVSAMAPLRLTASMVLGPAALSPGFPLALAALAFIVVNFTLSAIYGTTFLAALAYGGWLKLSPAALLPLGLGYGVLIWAVDALAIAPFWWPQFVVVDQVWQGLVPHIFYGLFLATYLIVARWNIVRGEQIR